MKFFKGIGILCLVFFVSCNDSKKTDSEINKAKKEDVLHEEEIDAIINEYGNELDEEE